MTDESPNELYVVLSEEHYKESGTFEAFKTLSEATEWSHCGPIYRLVLPKLAPMETLIRLAESATRALENLNAKISYIAALERVAKIAEDYCGCPEWDGEKTSMCKLCAARMDLSDIVRARADKATGVLP